MSENRKKSERAINYLLGELNEIERDALEERLFTDEEFSLFLDAVENDLIDGYVRGELDSAQHQRFENNYLISERRREKVHLAKVLNQEVFTEKTKGFSAAPVSVWRSFADFFRIPNIAWAGGLAAVFLLMLIGGVWLFRKNESNGNLVKIDNSNQQIVNQMPEFLPQAAPQDSGQTNSIQPIINTEKKLPFKNSSPSKREPEKQEKREPVTSPPTQKQSSIFAFTLLPPVRSGEKPVLKVPADAKTIRLGVAHDNDKNFIKYRTEIRDSSGDLIWSREIPVNQKTLPKPIFLNVRTGALAEGSYELTLSGITFDGKLEEINFYNFSIQKK